MQQGLVLILNRAEVCQDHLIVKICLNKQDKPDYDPTKGPSWHMRIKPK